VERRWCPIGRMTGSILNQTHDASTPAQAALPVTRQFFNLLCPSPEFGRAVVLRRSAERLPPTRIDPPKGDRVFVSLKPMRACGGPRHDARSWPRLEGSASQLNNGRSPWGGRLPRAPIPQWKNSCGAWPRRVSRDRAAWPGLAARGHHGTTKRGGSAGHQNRHPDGAPARNHRNIS